MSLKPGTNLISLTLGLLHKGQWLAFMHLPCGYNRIKTPNKASPDLVRYREDDPDSDGYLWAWIKKGKWDIGMGETFISLDKASPSDVLVVRWRRARWRWRDSCSLAWGELCQFTVVELAKLMLPVVYSKSDDCQWQPVNAACIFVCVHVHVEFRE